MTLAVVVPVFNEAAGIGPTLDALESQTDSDFDVFFVDNGSTDGSADVIAERGNPRWHIITETQKGTGAAADTGMRAAIAAGATLLARTDADCLPRADWTASVRRSLGELELVGGELVPRYDEGLGLGRRILLRAAVELAEAFGRVRPGNRSPEYRGPYMMAAGCNVAIRSDLYEAAGGFQRDPRFRLGHRQDAGVQQARDLPPLGEGAQFGRRAQIGQKGVDLGARLHRQQGVMQVVTGGRGRHARSTML